MSDHICPSIVYSDLVPGKNDDQSSGYIKGQIWIKSNKDVYQCIDNTDSAAIWEKLTSSTFYMKAGESLSPHDFCYVKYDTDGPRAFLADADSTSSIICTCICLETLSAGNSGRFFTHGFYTNTSWTWATSDYGKPVFLSETAGEITNTSPSNSGSMIQVLGWIYNSNTIYFNPDMTWAEVA